MKRDWIPALFLTMAVAAVPALGGDVADSADRVRPLLIGSDVPAITLQDASGAEVDGEALFDEPTVLIVYRGGW